MKCPHCQREYDDILMVTNVHGVSTFNGCLSCKQEFERDPRVRCGICRLPDEELVLALNPRTGQREPLCSVCLQTVAVPDLERLITTAA